MKLETAKRIYTDGPDWLKVELEDEFGKENLVEKDFKSIKTLKDAANSVGYPIEFIANQENETTDEWAYRMLKMVTKAINGIWAADWANTSQPKYYNYFGVHPSGVGFSISDANYSYEYTYVGSRLCFESIEKAKFARTQFEDLYVKYLLITK